MCNQIEEHHHLQKLMERNRCFASGFKGGKQYEKSNFRLYKQSRDIRRQWRLQKIQDRVISTRPISILQ